MSGLQAFNMINSNRFAKGRVFHCLILLLIASSPVFNSEPLLAQSSVNRIPTSITAAQRSTESMLQKAASTFSIRDGETLEVSDFLKLLNVTVFLDANLEGSVDLDSELTFQTGVSMAKSMQRALLGLDAVYLVERDGSIMLISIDDELEPGYLRTVIYDVTSLTGSINQSHRLAGWIQQTISTDSWEQNGTGNGTMAFYVHNGHILMAVTQSYSVQLKIRRHLTSTRRLAGSTAFAVSSTDSVTHPFESNRNSLPKASSTKLASSVVQVPSQYVASNRRMRRGFSRPDSGNSGALGGVFSMRD